MMTQRGSRSQGREWGHQDAFLRSRLSVRYRFSQGTFAGTRCNGRDAPEAVIRGTASMLPLLTEAVRKVITSTKASNPIALRMEYSNFSLPRSTHRDSKLRNHWWRFSFHTASTQSGRHRRSFIGRRARAKSGLTVRSLLVTSASRRGDSLLNDAAPFGAKAPKASCEAIYDRAKTVAGCGEVPL